MAGLAVAQRLAEYFGQQQDRADSGRGARGRRADHGRYPAAERMARHGGVDEDVGVEGVDHLASRPALISAISSSARASVSPSRPGDSLPRSPTRTIHADRAARGRDATRTPRQLPPPTRHSYSAGSTLHSGKGCPSGPLGNGTGNGPSRSRPAALAGPRPGGLPLALGHASRPGSRSADARRRVSAHRLSLLTYRDRNFPGKGRFTVSWQLDRSGTQCGRVRRGPVARWVGSE